MTGDWTWHGGALEAARQRFGDGDEPWLDLSTGINPQPWPSIDHVAIEWRRLPEQHALAELEATAADFFGLDSCHVCAVPGTEIGLRLAGRLIGGRACHVAPSYRTHSEMFEVAAAIDWVDAPHREDTLVVANPNNPNGRIIDPATLRALAVTRRPDGWLLVDEAFADCDPAISVAPAIRDDARLLVFRSFGKFFGLAGVRLGFVLGPRAFLVKLRRVLGAWPVSAAAVAIGTAAYRDTVWAEATRARLRSQASALDAVLARHGLAPEGECPLFRLVEVPNAGRLFARLAYRAILTRPFAESPDWLRIGLAADAQSLARLDAALGDG